MKNTQLDAEVLELIIHGIFPNATIPALGRVQDLIHDLALDWDAFGIWLDTQIQEEKLADLTKEVESLKSGRDKAKQRILSLLEKMEQIAE